MSANRIETAEFSGRVLMVGCGSIGQAMLPLVSAEPRQREFAFRAGVNIVMYTLTGNYKADQVHIPALLARLDAVAGRVLAR